MTATPTPTPAIASRAPPGPVIVKPPAARIDRCLLSRCRPAKTAPQETKARYPAAPAAASSAATSCRGSHRAAVEVTPVAGSQRKPTGRTRAASRGERRRNRRRPTAAASHAAVRRSSRQARDYAADGTAADLHSSRRERPRRWAACSAANRFLSGLVRRDPAAPGGATLWFPSSVPVPAWVRVAVRRPMHPTRQHPTGAPGSRPGMPGRPGFGAPRPGIGVAPGMAPPPGAGPIAHRADTRSAAAETIATKSRRKVQ